MKITTEIFEILKNFSLINKSIMIYEGNKIRTISENKNVFAEYVLTGDEFSKDFGIYSISEFLSIISLFEEPEIDFYDNYMKIFSSNSSTSVKYIYANENVIITPGREKTIKFPTPDLKFVLTNDNLSLLKKAAAVLKADELCVQCFSDDESPTAYLKLQNGANSSSNTFDLKIEMKNACTKDFQFKISTNHLLFMSNDYTVQCSEKGILKFETLNEKLVYFIPTIRS